MMFGHVFLLVWFLQLVGVTSGKLDHGDTERIPIKLSGLGFLSEGCKNLVYNPRGSSVLIGFCDDQVCGNFVETHLDLNNCILNKNGNMYWNKSGAYFKSCGDCHFDSNHHFYCSCRNNDHVEQTSIINLDEGLISNYYGYLNCYATINSDLYAHNWPCKGEDWTPWTSKAKHGGSGGGNPDSAAASDGTGTESRAYVPDPPMFPLPPGVVFGDGTTTAGPSTKPSAKTHLRCVAGSTTLV